MTQVVNEQNDINGINFVAGLSDPGEMIRCGYRPELRRLAGEGDLAYANRIRPLVMALPQVERDVILTAAVRRASLDNSSGRIACVVAGEPAWHGLGKQVSGAMTSAEAIRLAEQDWEVELWDSPARHPATGKVINDDSRRKAVRSDTHAVLGTVGVNYTPLQNREAFDFMDEVIGHGLAKYETAGAVMGGRRVWMLARLPQTLVAADGDETKPYVLLMNAHDGSMAVRVLATTVRVVCNNTMNLAGRSGGSGVAIRHTKSMKGKVAEARRALNVVARQVDEYGQKMELMASVAIGQDVARGVYRKWFPDQTRPATVPSGTDGAATLAAILEGHDQSREVVAGLLEAHYAATERIAKRNGKILDRLLENFAADPARGTVWGAFNAVTEYADHQTTWRGEGEERADNRLCSAWWGAGHKLKEEALQEFVTVAATR